MVNKLYFYIYMELKYCLPCDQLGGDDNISTDNKYKKKYKDLRKKYSKLNIKKMMDIKLEPITEDKITPELNNMMKELWNSGKIQRDIDIIKNLEMTGGAMEAQWLYDGHELRKFFEENLYKYFEELANTNPKFKEYVFNSDVVQKGSNIPYSSLEVSLTHV